MSDWPFTPPPSQPVPRRRKGDPAPDPAQVMAEAEKEVRIVLRFALAVLVISLVALGMVLGSLLCH